MYHNVLEDIVTYHGLQFASKFGSNCLFKLLGVKMKLSLAFHSSFYILWQSILCFMFLCWNFTMHLPFQEKSMISFHLLKSMVNRNMKWRTFWIHGFLIINYSILFIGMGMMWANAFGNHSKTYQILWKRCMSFIDDI